LENPYNFRATAAAATTTLPLFRISLFIVYRSLNIYFAADRIYETYAVNTWRQACQISVFNRYQYKRPLKCINESTGKVDTKHLLRHFFWMFSFVVCFLTFKVLMA
jgi:hypothetical protein